MPPELTVTLLVAPSALPELAAATNVPPFTVVLPLKVFAPVRTTVPAPLFTSAMLPCAPLLVPAITPAKVVDVPLAGFTVNVLVVLATLFFTVAVLSPLSDATASL